MNIRQKTQPNRPSIDERDDAKVVRQPPTPIRTISSDTLFLGESEVCIAHDGSIYRLKITRQGKLILNK